MSAWQPHFPVSPAEEPASVHTLVRKALWTEHHTKMKVLLKMKGTCLVFGKTLSSDICATLKFCGWKSWPSHLPPTSAGFVGWLQDLPPAFGSGLLGDHAGKQSESVFLLLWGCCRGQGHLLLPPDSLGAAAATGSWHSKGTAVFLLF